MWDASIIQYFHIMKYFFWKEHLVHDLFNHCDFVHHLSHCLLTILEQLIFLVFKKPDNVRFVAFCEKHCFLVEHMIKASETFLLFEVRATYQQTDSSFQFIFSVYNCSWWTGSTQSPGLFMSIRCEEVPGYFWRFTSC